MKAREWNALGGEERRTRTIESHGYEVTSINFKVISLTLLEFRTARFESPDLPKTTDGRSTHSAIPSGVCANMTLAVARM